MKYRRKEPVLVEAVQFTGDNYDEIFALAGQYAKIIGREKALHVVVLNDGLVRVSPSEYVIRDSSNLLRVCRSELFEASYEAIE